MESGKPLVGETKALAVTGKERASELGDSEATDSSNELMLACFVIFHACILPYAGSLGQGLKADFFDFFCELFYAFLLTRWADKHILRDFA